MWKLSRRVRGRGLCPRNRTYQAPLAKGIQPPELVSHLEYIYSEPVATPSDNERACILESAGEVPSHEVEVIASDPSYREW